MADGKRRRAANLAILAALVVCAIAIAYLSLRPPAETPGIAGSDKLGHLIAYASLGAFALLVAGPARWLPVFLAATLYGAGLEVMQGAMAHGREASLLDGIANAVGAGLGIAAVAFWQRR